jgi:hypothetical protein
MTNKVDINLLHERFNYYPETGIFTYKTKNAKSSKPVGSLAGTKLKGSIRIHFNRKNFPAHHLAWAMYYGYWAPEMIDHINGDFYDNRIKNLRLATKFENARNKSLHKNSKTGVKGVQWKPKRGTFYSKITFNRKVYFLGEFKTIEEASHAYNYSAKKLHKEFAKLSHSNF